jgi:hypothetical protein
VVNVAVPSPERPAPWVTACDWEWAAVLEGAFDPESPDACPGCRAFALDGGRRLSSLPV